MIDFDIGNSIIISRFHLELSLNWLARTPFTDYRMPGIILFIANGLMSWLVLC